MLQTLPGICGNSIWLFALQHSQPLVSLAGERQQRYMIPRLLGAAMRAMCSCYCRCVGSQDRRVPKEACRVRACRVSIQLLHPPACKNPAAAERLPLLLCSRENFRATGYVAEDNSGKANIYPTKVKSSEQHGLGLHLDHSNSAICVRVATSLPEQQHS